MELSPRLYSEVAVIEQRIMGPQGSSKRKSK
jgi:hypothetical protein